MKINEIEKRNEELKQCAEILAKHLSTLPKRKPFFEQAPSTMAILARDPKDDEAHFNRPLPEAKDWMRDHTIQGNWDIKQIAVIEDIRRKARNDFGSSFDSSTNKEKKEKAISAFTCSPPAEPTKTELLRTTEMKKLITFEESIDRKIKELTEKKSFLKRIIESFMPKKKPNWDEHENAKTIYKSLGGKVE